MEYVVPIELQLLREGHVILDIYTDPLDVKDITKNIPRHNEIMDRSTHLIHSITDATGLTKLPTNFLSGSTKSLKIVHPMAGINVVVTNNHFLNSIAAMIIKLVPQNNIKIFGTMNAGWAEIDRILVEEATR